MSTDSVKNVVKELLSEIPSQMTAYMDMKNIPPNIKADGTIDKEIDHNESEINEVEKKFFERRFEEIKKKAIEIAVKDEHGTEQEVTQKIEKLISEYGSPDIRPEWLVQNISKNYTGENKLKSAYE